MTPQTIQKTLCVLDPSTCDRHPYQRSVDQDHVDELVEVIKEHGYSDRNPILVIPNKENPEHWLVVSGWHRVLAAIKANVSQIYAEVKNEMTDSDILKLIPLENKCRPFSMIDMGRHFRLTKQIEPDTNQRSFSKMVGVSQPYISICVAVSELADDPRIDEHMLKEIQPTALSAITRAPKEDWITLINQALSNGLSVEQVNNEVKRSKELQKYKDQQFENPSDKLVAEPVEQLVFVVPVSTIATIQTALKIVKDKFSTRPDLPEMSDGRALYWLASSFIESEG